MSVLVKQVEDKLCELVRDAAKKAMAAGELPEAELTDFKVEIPADRKNGDYSTNAAMAWARAFRRAPAMIAAAITKNIDLEGTAFSSCEAAGPGFINFRLADRFYSEILMDIRKKGSDYLIDHKVPLPEKARQFVLLSGDEIVWLVGRRIDDRYRLTAETENVLRITKEII